MLSHFQKLLEMRTEIDTKDRSNAVRIKKALWCDKVAEINARYKLDEFILQVNDLDAETFPNIDIIARIMDILSLIRNDDSMQDQNSYLVTPSAHRGGPSSRSNQMIKSQVSRRTQMETKSSRSGRSPMAQSQKFGKQMVENS